MNVNLYALLIGIDEYPTPVLPLKGCVNDINAVEIYLKERVANDQYRLHLQILKNEQATRQAVIDGFRQHLCQAQRDDVVLFYYSGHGSQEKAQEIFWHLEPDRLNETLVCYDSRLENSWDLADKELATLIAEVAENEPHICVILDCCHSGTGTKHPLQEMGVRRIPIAQRPLRPMANFIFSQEKLEQRLTIENQEPQNHGWSIMPKGRHVLLAACRDLEDAKEYYGHGEYRGAFSYFLMDTLQKARGKLIYRDLFKRTEAILHNHVSTQSPQIEIIKPENNIQAIKEEQFFFLDGVIAEYTPYFTVSHHKKYGWVMDGGAVHGIQKPVGDETTLLALFPFDSSFEELHDPKRTLGEGKVTQVLPQLSKVNLTGIDNLSKDDTFKAIITSLPLIAMGVYFEGDETGLRLARQALQTIGFDNQPSLYVREETILTQAQFRLLATEGKYLIIRLADDRPLVDQLVGYTKENAEKAIQRLEHIARWISIVELSGLPTSRIHSGDIKMEFILENENPILAKQQRFEYIKTDHDKWEPPAFRLKLTNQHKTKDFYCALLNLSESYRVSAPFFDVSSVLLHPGEEIWALDGEELVFTLPDEFWQQGITEYKDIIKLIVCTTPFDVTLLTQDKLDIHRPPDSHKALQSTLDRLMARIQRREVKARSQGQYDDWFTEQVTITTILPLETFSVPNLKPDISLGFGVTVQVHPDLQAKVRLTTIPQASRDLGKMVLPSILRENPEITQTLQFTTSRGTDPGLSVLELSEVQNLNTVTTKTPLTLLIDQPLADHEFILPIGYDGEFFLPLGRSSRTEKGQIKIELQRLPAPVSEGYRSLSGSIHILFQKIVKKPLGLSFEYPILAVAEVDTDETVFVEKEMTKVRSRVVQANRILLYIHGIFGDTLDMARSVQRAQFSLKGQQHSLKAHYDLVLTFDYESLNTANEEIARSLKQRLESVGLGAAHGKTLHIVAHSMGGLISRWFIEREGGHRVVQHLIMLGTPNAGSPWATVQNWATIMTAIALNGLSPVVWPSNLLTLLVVALEAGDINLDQMNPKSVFLNSLAASDDPDIPYAVIAGNTALIQNQTEQALLQRLVEKLLSLPFFGQPNDLAVTVESIQALPQHRKMPAKIQEVACDHFSYFNTQAGLNALVAALEEGDDR